MKKPSIEDVMNRYEDQLLSHKVVVGVGVGESSTEGLCIKVYVSKRNTKAEEAIPKKLDGYTVEIEEIGEVKAL